MSTAAPQFFYFDLGNVLLNFDHEIACRQMAEVANVEVDRVREIVFESDLEWRYERGELTTKEFYEAFCEQANTKPDYDALKHAAAAIFELNEPVERIVRSLESLGRRLGILSNTCEAHWDFVTDGRFEVLNGTFEIFALSYRLRSMKPEAQIYTAAAELAGVAPQEIFFVDDRADNVVAARQAGYDVVQFTGAVALACELRKRGAAV